MKRLSKSVVGKKEVEAVKNVLLNDGYLGMGNEVKKFENEISKYLNVDSKNVVCVSSGTSALHLAVEATLKPNEEVLVPSFTFISSYQAISAARCIPISCEIYDNNLSIDLEDAEKKITNKTKAIMPVFYASNPTNLEKLYSFANKYNLRVIEDAAHAFGCLYKNKKIGSFGDIICFSFDGIKNITSGEGGAIITTDKNVLSSIKDKRLLGIENDTIKRYSSKRSWDFDVKSQGYRYHMSNIFAAIGRSQLKRLDIEFIPKRILLMNMYISLLKNNPYLIFIDYDSNSKIIPHIFPIRVLKNKRDQLKVHLEELNIQTGIHYKPNHLLSFYGGGIQKLEVTENVYREILSLPLHPDLEIKDIEEICLIINKFLNNL